MYYNSSPYHAILFFCITSTVSVLLFVLLILFVRWINNNEDSNNTPDAKRPKMCSKELFDLLKRHQEELEGKIWRHKSSGNDYWVTTCCLNTKTQRVNVVYLRYMRNGFMSAAESSSHYEFYTLFTRDFAEFKEKFECVDKVATRLTLTKSEGV